MHGLNRSFPAMWRCSATWVFTLATAAALGISAAAAPAQVTDDMLKHVGGIRTLKSLHLTGCDIDDRKLSQLKALTELEFLELGGTQVSDAGLQHLTGMKTLDEVHLSNTNVSGSNLTALEGLKRLRVLRLGGPNFTDISAALASLKMMPSLRRLQLIQVELNDEARQDIRIALPDCKIQYL